VFLVGLASVIREHAIKTNPAPLLEMEFKQVIQTCLNFAAANDGTIQSYPAGCKTNQLDIGPRTARTVIHIEQVQTGDWQVEQTQNAVGEKNNQTREIVSTEQDLLEYLSRFWDKVDDLAPARIRALLIPSHAPNIKV
jgi:hypothetical protein